MLIASLAGVLVGLGVSYVNQDNLGWSLLRAAGLGVCFAIATRWILISLLRNWIETRREMEDRRGKDALSLTGSSGSKIK
jgi:hypothetical protein